MATNTTIINIIAAVVFIFKTLFVLLLFGIPLILLYGYLNRDKLEARVRQKEAEAAAKAAAEVAARKAIIDAEAQKTRQTILRISQARKAAMQPNSDIIIEIGVTSINELQTKLGPVDHYDDSTLPEYELFVWNAPIRPLIIELYKDVWKPDRIILRSKRLSIKVSRAVVISLLQ